MSKSDKKVCGAWVVMKNGKRYLGEPDHSRIITHADSEGYIQEITMMENDEVVFCAPVDNVSCWGNKMTFFKDAWWAKETP